MMKASVPMVTNQSKELWRISISALSQQLTGSAGSLQNLYNSKHYEETLWSWEEKTKVENMWQKEYEIDADQIHQNSAKVVQQNTRTNFNKRLVSG